MEKIEERMPLMALNNTSFRNFLLLNYLKHAKAVNHKDLSYITKHEEISDQTWIQLHNLAKADLEIRGNMLRGYDIVNEQVIIHENFLADEWPSERFWIIEKSMEYKLAQQTVAV